MNAIRKILAATDLSDSSLAAVERGFEIAARTGADYSVMHALGLDSLSAVRELLAGELARVSRRISDDVQNELQELLGNAQRNRGVDARLILDERRASIAVPQRAEALGIDLIVLGAHGKGFLERALLGSTTSNLLRKSRCPVLVVKDRRPRGYQKVLVTADFSAVSPHNLRLAQELAPSADLVLLHVYEVPFEGRLRIADVRDEAIQQYRIDARERALKQLHDMAHRTGLARNRYTARALYGDPTRQILLEEELHDCDLIVMGKHGTHTAEEMLLGSVTKNILAESRADVLVVVEKVDSAS